jgi:hypothetical protein
MERSDLQAIKSPLYKYHRFLDEAGDPTFYGKGKIPIIGNEGVSNYFLVGMLTVNEPLDTVRQNIMDLQNNIAADPYFHSVPSIRKKKETIGYFLHAKDDVPEVRKMTFELIKTIDCYFDVAVGRKDCGIYERKHNGNQSEFYADLLSHLLIDDIKDQGKLVLNIAHRSKCTTHTNLNKGLEKALIIAGKKYPYDNINCKAVFNVQQPTNEPVINIADYFLWAVQRNFERSEKRYMDFLGGQFRTILNLYNDKEEK